MSCIYSDFHSCCCQLFDEDIDEGLGVSEDGVCICEDDLEPSNSCSNYESGDSDEDEDYV